MDVVILDKMVTSHGRNIKAVYRKFRDISEKTSKICGINIIFAGDFWQTLPVLALGSTFDIKEECVRPVQLFPAFKISRLTEIMRFTRLM